MNYDIVIVGLSITSSWGNGHATTYRSLARGLAGRGHRVLFLEHDTPWYAENRDTPQPPGTTTRLYSSFEELIERFEAVIRDARLVILGSYVQDGARVGDWVTSVARGRTAFYDIDTPVTLAKFARGDFEYLSPKLIPQFSMYLSFTGGPTLKRLETQYRSPMARAFYCAVNPQMYANAPALEAKFDLGYLGTYSEDRQPSLDRLLLDTARRRRHGQFIVAGPQYPDSIAWPRNVERVEHLAPDRHAWFYGSQRFTLNITRRDMIAAG
ncbi:MAG: glycosyltransferase, partial [Bryobacterales bacterium]|nr:glycosyltransferase [Bryobacterales bacterium]